MKEEGLKQRRNLRYKEFPPVQVRPLSPEEKAGIFEGFVGLAYPKKEFGETYQAMFPNFCIDGRRAGPIIPGLTDDELRKAYAKEVFLQTPGGSYTAVVLRWLLTNGGQTDFSDSARDTFRLMNEGGMKIGTHTGQHKKEGKTSDCGFMDNLKKIIRTMIGRNAEIFSILSQADSSLREKEVLWNQLFYSLDKVKLGTIPNGNILSKIAKKAGGDTQELEGEHAEIAAVINKVPWTTYNPTYAGLKAFNLDVWHVADQAEKLGLYIELAKLLSMGLFVATEMVLVEDKGKSRLPILINDPEDQGLIWPD